MTLQQIFDKVLTYLRTQGRPAVSYKNNVTTCVYRANNGDKCAVGCLVPDELYTPDIEGYSVKDGMLREHKGDAKAALLMGILYEAGLADTPNHLYLLCDLQKEHDAALRTQMAKWEDGMADIAKKFGLEYTPVGG